MLRLRLYLFVAQVFFSLSPANVLKKDEKREKIATSILAIIFDTNGPMCRLCHLKKGCMVYAQAFGPY